MAKATIEQDVAPDAATSDQTLVQALARLVNASEDGPIKQMSIVKAKFRTPWNPTGDKDRPKLARKYRLNGAQMRDRMLSNTEIDLLNKLVPGKYRDGKWFVLATEEDGSTIDVYLPNKTVAQRMELANAAPDLTGILTIITTEAADKKKARRVE